MESKNEAFKVYIYNDYNIAQNNKIITIYDSE